MTAQVAADLMATADVIQERGWTRCKFQGTNGKVCSSGALRLVIFGTANDLSTILVLSNDNGGDRYIRAVNFLSDYLGNSVIHWNDCIAEDAEQVINTLRQASYAAGLVMLTTED